MIRQLVKFIAQLLGVRNMWLLFCHTMISGATLKIGTSIIIYFNKLLN